MTPDDLTSSIKSLVAIGKTMGDLRVFRFRQRCPHCDAYWLWDSVAAIHEVDLAPDPIKQGMANLCGRCEALRMAFVVDRNVRFPSDHSMRYVSWGEFQDRKSWAKLRNYASEYKAKITHSTQTVTTHKGRSATLESGDVVELRDDKQGEIDRIFSRGHSRPISLVLLLSEAIELGLDISFDAPVMESPKSKGPAYAGGTKFKPNYGGAS